MKTLVVGDDQIGNNLLRAILESEGHQVCEAFDGSEALTILTNSNMDLVISDANMPVMSGYKLISKIREDVRFKHIAFILYTASSTSAGSEKLAEELGVDIYLRKTGSIKEIVQAIKQMVDGNNNV
jgi:CheY-like chemotaxis protein